MSSSVSSVFLQHLQQARQHEGTVQNNTLKSAKNTPQPTRLGPISFNSNVRKPLSPRPTNGVQKSGRTKSGKAKNDRVEEAEIDGDFQNKTLKSAKPRLR
jgi:hypothetical protein